MADALLVCSLSKDELGARRAQLLSGLVAAATRIDELADGYRLTFEPASGVLDTIARVIDTERQCCRFLRFQLVVEQDAAPITLDVTGPPGTTEFLEELLGGRVITYANPETRRPRRTHGVLGGDPI